MQNTQGVDSSSRDTDTDADADASAKKEKENMLTVAKSLYKKYGINIFFDGLAPKMYRAAVNHAVTFFVYDLLMRKATGISLLS
jgi:solute carrier family 25 carnitine/acylcarnitine transporter 20/29